MIPARSPRRSVRSPGFSRSADETGGRLEDRSRLQVAMPTYISRNRFILTTARSGGVRVRGHQKKESLCG